MKLIMTIKMPHQKHFLKITLLFFKNTKRKDKNESLFSDKNCTRHYEVYDRYWPQLSIDSFQKIAYNLKSAYS